MSIGTEKKLTNSTLNHDKMTKSQQTTAGKGLPQSAKNLQLTSHIMMKYLILSL